MVVEVITVIVIYVLLAMVLGVLLRSKTEAPLDQAKQGTDGALIAAGAPRRARLPCLAPRPTCARVRLWLRPIGTERSRSSRADSRISARTAKGAPDARQMQSDPVQRGFFKRQ
jgi:hypothetical protein